MKTYIAGPMSGLPEFNRRAFFAAAAEIAASGDTPLNPAVLPDGLSEADYMAISLAMLQRAEYALAEKLGIEVLFQELKPEQCLALA
ncbi:hypothetical protein BL250_07600 [Erwinia sp. OLTSP20]|uniref:DUF4406 domain-containing protein n=1 Tax=unclassified Erwinia TaxID=2622719 RepID=UPI000C187176|nr:MULTISPECIES: DUF4406 domain-containing protein [unclassified Erwinia]PIJ50666.1 hypothetical protein BV501_07880 [Erwinia sp. OAMSP11]PIJ72710.1 hypothetical protein BK416_08740 [Erwinia sp. OLSSP12]PIJ83207.1 hypothetical protein BLD47_05015 [Erwinia sp. OLCASP19]PIJ85291.1 hypothetical protein BLD46_06710 [Erwinia sp. OLMTSP26]PIJ87293.1 hypothetical protein BLD49_06725 [Erwinia sp. OLMDSP33]